MPGDDREYRLETLGSWAHHPYKLVCFEAGKVGTTSWHNKHADAEAAGRTWIATGVAPAHQPH